jgi:hypothetical protein
METKLLSGDLENIWIIQPINGGIRYVYSMPFWQFSFSLPWEYAQIKELEFMNDKTSGGEIYYTPTVSVEGYEAFGMEGLLLGEDERHQRPIIHTICFYCALTDGRCFVAEVSPRDWMRWQKLTAKPFKPPTPKEQRSFSGSWKSTSWITKAAIYVFLYFLALAFLGFIGETVTHAVKAGWNHLSHSSTPSDKSTFTGS